MFTFFLILFSILLVLYYQFFKNKMYNPIFLFSTYWLVFVISAMIFSEVFDYYYYYEGFLIIVLYVLMFTLGGVITLFKPVTKGKEKYFFKVNNLRKVVLFLSILGAGAIFVILRSQGFGIQMLFNLSNFFEMANTISIERYDNTLNLPLSYKIFSIFIYSGVVFSAILFMYKERKKDYLLSFFPLTLALVNAMINGARAGLLMAILLFISTVISVVKLKNIKISLMNVVKNLTVVIFFFLFILVFIQFLRGGKEDQELMPIVKHMMGYLFGSLNCFTMWWETAEITNDLGLGKYTFSGIHNMIFGGREVGLYSKSLLISKDGIESNVYTIFRATIDDFSLLGSFGIFIMLGNIGANSYRKIKENSNHIITLSTLYFVVFWSFITNPLTYNTLLLSCVLNYFIIKFVVKKC